MQVLQAICNAVAAAALVAMVIIIMSEIVARNLFGVSLQLSEEVAGYLLVAIAFFGFSNSYRRGDLMRIEMVYDRLPHRLRRTLDIAFDLFALIAIGISCYYSSRYVWSSFLRNTHAPTLLETPLWIPQLAIPLGLAALCIALVHHIRENAVELVGSGHE